MDSVLLPRELGIWLTKPNNKRSAGRSILFLLPKVADPLLNSVIFSQQTVTVQALVERGTEQRSAEEQTLCLAMERYVIGDMKAFEIIYDSLASKLLGYLTRIMQSRVKAEDVLQAAFLKVHGARNRWTPGSRLTPWVFAIARNLAMDELRKNQRSKLRLTSTGIVPDIAAVEPDEEVNVALIRQALESLPESYREVIELTKFSGLSLNDAAQIVGTTEGAVKQRLHRAYEKLRIILPQLSEEFSDV